MTKRTTGAAQAALSELWWRVRWQYWLWRTRSSVRAALREQEWFLLGRWIRERLDRWLA